MFIQAYDSVLDSDRSSQFGSQLAHDIDQQIDIRFHSAPIHNRGRCRGPNAGCTEGP